MTAAPFEADATAARTHVWSRDRILIASLVLSSIFWLLVWYLDTVISMVSIWVRSDTFAHGFLIAPISAWLIWQRRSDLALLEIRPGMLALPCIALAGFGWLLGYLAGAGVIQQYGVVAMIPLLVWALLGHAIARALAFPLLYLLFAVPVGEFLEPLLMEHTADFTVFALRLTGIPVYREGQFFMIPTGNWSVVEACSGLRYLIASLTLGLLYAYLSYRSLARRALFVLASFVVPIVANWLRAYMIVMIGHLSGMKYAVGVDHLIYGWLFFGVVMLLLFWVGSFWREDLAPEPPARAAPRTFSPNSPPAMSIGVVALSAAAIVAVWPIAASLLDGKGPYPKPVLGVPESGGGWRPITGRLTTWTPHFIEPRAQINQVYTDGSRRAGLYLGYYRNQNHGAQLVSSQNVLITSDNPAWGKTRETMHTLGLGDESVRLIEAELRGRDQRLLVWRWYWIGGTFTTSPYLAKFLQAKAMLFRQGDAAAVVILYTELGVDREPAAATLGRFAGSMLPAIRASLRDAR